MRLPQQLLFVVILGLTTSTAIADEENLDEFKAIEKIELLGGKIRRDDTLPGRPVVEVNFKENKRFSYRYLRLLTPFSELKTLNVSATQITDAGMLEIGRHTSLTSLYIARTEISDAGTKELRHLKNLTTLNLVGNKITDAGLKSIGELTNLERLHIGRSDVTEVGLKELNNLKQLRELNLANSNLNYTCVKELSQLTSLTILFLGRNEITDEGLIELGNLKNLLLLEYVPNKTTSTGEATLKKSLPNLMVGSKQPIGKPIFSLKLPLESGMLDDLIRR